MKLRYLIVTINMVFFTQLIQIVRQQNFEQQNDKSIEIIASTQISSTTIKALALSLEERMQGMNSTNTISNSSITLGNKTIATPPSKAFREYLRCRQLNSLNWLPSPHACRSEFEDDLRICWNATSNGTMASNIIEYDHGPNNFYDGVPYGIENCTVQRFCQSNGSWAMTVSPEIQCKLCVGDGRPVKFNSISIMIETMSLSLSLVSLTIAILCMMNIKYVSYLYVKACRLDLSDVKDSVHRSPRSATQHFFVVPPKMPLLCKYLLLFRRLHLPRNLLHMHLFVAFIFRSIVKLVFIHLIIGGYTRTMIQYKRDKCGNIEIFSKSSNLFHILGCRTLSSLFWYTDAVSQTFVFCEAMFLFTALTSHLFRDRGCLPFILWGWLSPFIWLTMWIASHTITDKLKRRSTCWLEADNTTYFYYFFYVPYAFYLLINFGIFLYLVRLLYSKYQTYNIQNNRTGNRHLIKSILILIPLFGLHSLFVIWVFYHKNEGHTIWYYVAVIFKAVFGDLQGFFTSLIYFYFNTEIRYEVLRQVQRVIITNETVRRSSAVDTLSTRLSTFRRSISRHRHSSIQNRNERRRMNLSNQSSSSSKSIHETRSRKCLLLICPCWLKLWIEKRSFHDEQQNEQNNYNETMPAMVPELIVDDIAGASSPLIVQVRSTKATIDADGQTCDTILMKNEHEDYELLTDENDVTYHQSSCHAEQTSSSSNQMPMLMFFNSSTRKRSYSEGCVYTSSPSHYSTDSKSLN